MLRKSSSTISGGLAVSTGETAAVRPEQESDTTGTAAASKPKSGTSSTILFSISPDAGLGLSWGSADPLVHMLADLVAASDATPLGDTAAADGLLSATGSSANHAVVLAARALRLAAAYGAPASGVPRTLTVAVFAAPPKGSSPETAVRSALQQSGLAGNGLAGKLVVAGEALVQLRAAAGLQLRKVSMPGGQRVEMQEVVLPAIEVAEPAPIAVGAKPSEAVVVLPVRAAAALEAETPTGGGGMNMKLVLAISVAAAIAIGVAVFALSGSHGKAPAPAAVAPATAPAIAPTETKPAVEAPAAIPTSAAPVPPAAASPLVRAGRPAPTAGGGKDVKEAAAAKPVATEAAPPKAAESDAPAHGGYSAEQLRTILDKADSLTANGKYAEAIRNYNVVLASEPGNARARSGKERAITNQNMK